MSETAAYVAAVYKGSNGEATAKLYEKLLLLGPTGFLATNLFRAQKASERAKGYRGKYVRMAYDKKQWAIDNLTGSLNSWTGSEGTIVWGWGLDDKQPVHKHVLYVELPGSIGQVSFHSTTRGKGPDFPGKWDEMPGQSADRIVRWVARVLDGRV